MAAGLFLTNWNRLGGSGTGIWFKGRKVGGGMACPATPHAVPPVRSEPVMVRRPQRVAIAGLEKRLFFMVTTPINNYLKVYQANYLAQDHHGIGHVDLVVR